jgi:hypothetical protein
VVASDLIGLLDLGTNQFKVQQFRSPEQMAPFQAGLEKKANVTSRCRTQLPRVY